MKDIFNLNTDDEDFIFIKALEFLKDKITLNYDEYKQLREKYKALAFSVSGYTSLEILNEFKNELENAIKEGTTKETFREKMNTFLAEKGYTELTPYRTDTIFRTNNQTAYNVGHHKNMTDPNVLRNRPLWQYKTAGDGKVREAHQAMDDKVFYADDPIWDEWYPPNGYRCRCIVVSLTKSQVERKNLEIESELPYEIDKTTGELIEAKPDKGFRTNPAKVEFNPDLKDFPKNLKKAFNKRIKDKS